MSYKELLIQCKEALDNDIDQGEEALKDLRKSMKRARALQKKIQQELGVGVETEVETSSKASSVPISNPITCLYCGKPVPADSVRCWNCRQNPRKKE